MTECPLIKESQDTDDAEKLKNTEAFLRDLYFTCASMNHGKVVENRKCLD